MNFQSLIEQVLTTLGMDDCYRVKPPRIHEHILTIEKIGAPKPTLLSNTITIIYTVYHEIVITCNSKVFRIGTFNNPKFKDNFIKALEFVL